MHIEQAIYGGQDAGGYHFLARSAGFLDAWLADAERLCTGFGERPAGVKCPLAVFARPLGKKHVAVVQVADQGSDDTGRPGALAFRLLVLPARFYSDLGADPFWIAEQLPPPWRARGELEVLEWTSGPQPRRTTDDLRRVLDVAPERTQMLLGGVQVLIDGGRLVFVRNQPDGKLVSDLWALLPVSSRVGIWPASFAFGNAHHFHVAVVPQADGPTFEAYVREEQDGDYPEGQYELALQRAVESSDQADLDALLSRRSRSQTMRLAAWLLVVFALIALIIHGPFGRMLAPEEQEKERQAAKKDEPLKLSPPEHFSSPNDEERLLVSARLVRLTRALGVAPPADNSEKALGEGVVELDRRLDERMGAKKPRRDPGEAVTSGPLLRRLQALLWKHGVADYNQAGVSAAELVDRLRERLVKEGVLEEKGSD
jgi:hypothetical protein